MPFVLGGLMGIPLGVLLLPFLDMVWFKAILGTLMVFWGSAMLMAKHLPKITSGGRLADGAIGMVGGVLGGLGGFTGTVPTLWCTLRGFPKDEQRIVIQNFNLSMLMVTMGTYLATGIVKAEMLPYFGIVAAAMLVPTLLGTRLYIGISEARFRQIVLGLITLSGVFMLSYALPLLIKRYLA